jgi:hypothetical protein
MPGTLSYSQQMNEACGNGLWMNMDKYIHKLLACKSLIFFILLIFKVGGKFHNLVG